MFNFPGRERASPSRQYKNGTGVIARSTDSALKRNLVAHGAWARQAQPKWPKWGRQHEHEQPDTGKKKVGAKKKKEGVACRRRPDGAATARKATAQRVPCATCPPVLLRPPAQKERGKRLAVPRRTTQNRKGH